MTASDELERIFEFLGSIEVDFGYAVGNLNMDTTPENRKEIIVATRRLIRNAQIALLSRIKEKGPQSESWAEKDNSQSYAAYEARAANKNNLEWHQAIDDIAKEIRGTSDGL